ncbi:MAG: hypothetical protein CME61_04695 [Halobacteriovoraceae bacterium]|nr:hypothetical protein [Halobacteriovoraceae bacterium]
MKHKIVVARNKTAKEFMDTNDSLLRQDVTSNNFFLGFATQIIKGEINSGEEIFLTVYENDKVIGQAINTDKDHNLLLTKMSARFAPYIVNEFLKYRNEVFGVGGDQVISQSVAEELGKVIDKNYRINDHLGIYELNSLIMPDICESILLQQNEVEENLVLDWTIAFIKECHLAPNIEPVEVAKNLLKRHKSTKGYRFLRNVDGEIVSMAVKHREFEDRATVSYVYTPPKYRRKGYGKIVTALLSKELLEGKYVQCNLFTDMKNPTSNKIYQEIGYKFIGESFSYIFYQG